MTAGDARDDGPLPVDVPGLPALLPRPGPRGGGERDAPAFVYSPALGELIADLYIDEPGGLWGLQAAMPDRIPPPATVRAWARQHPAFGILLRDAERLRAEKLMEESVIVADTSPAPAPRVALMIAARQRMAEKLDAARWGNGGGTSGANAAALAREGDQPVALELTDDALAAIALAGSGQAAGGQAEGGAPR